MSGESPSAEARALVFPSICVSRSPPLALEVTRDLDKEDRRIGRRGNDLGGRGLRDAVVGSTSDHVRKVFFLAFPLLSSARPKSRGS
jgi:hypothetical protein